MPQVTAAVLRSTPASTIASASIRRAAAPSCSPRAPLRSSEAVRSSRVIDTAAPIDAAPLKGQHRVRVSLIWESLMSHSFGPLVLVTTSTPENPAFPHAMVYGLFRVLPGARALWSPSPVELLPQTWRQRRGVRTTRLFRPLSRRSSPALPASTASRSALRDVAQRTSVGRDGGTHTR